MKPFKTDSPLIRTEYKTGLSIRLGRGRVRGDQITLAGGARRAEGDATGVKSELGRRRGSIFQLENIL